jgi:hypothetical protein
LLRDRLHAGSEGALLTPSGKIPVYGRAIDGLCSNASAEQRNQRARAKRGGVLKAHFLPPKVPFNFLC